MVNLAPELSIFASVIWFGYSLSLLTRGYKSVCKKVEEFRKLLLSEAQAVSKLRISNLLLSGLLSLSYVVLLSFAGFVFWVLALVVVKFSISLFLSDLFETHLLDRHSIPIKLYLLMRIDSVFNACLALFIPLCLIL